MEIVLDDIGLYVTVFSLKEEVGEFGFKSEYDFRDFVKSVLSKSQYETLVGTNTHRKFSVSKKKQSLVTQKLK